MLKKSSTALITVLVLALLVSCQLTSGLDLQSPTATKVVTTPLPQFTPAPTTVVKVEGIGTVDVILTNLYQQVNQGVVNIISSSSAGDGSGSGFVYDKDGHIITNYHVVEGADTIEVDFASGLKVYGNLVATDLDSDIAVVKVDVAEEQLVPLKLGDSDALQVGQMVVAIGNPYRLTSTMTMGIISAKGRVLDSIRQTADLTAYTAGDLIQTDAAINPGNSGGPLLNLSGEVVGINRAIYAAGSMVDGQASNIGIGYAVSINIVKRVVPVLISEGKYNYPLLGISSSSNDLTLKEWKTLSDTITSGIYIMDVTSGGPAEKAGLIPGSRPTDTQGFYSGGDIIIAVDGMPVHVYGDLISYVFKNKSPGDEIVLTIVRNEQQKEVKLTLGSR
mgnify:CR=1 FL=1